MPGESRKVERWLLRKLRPHPQQASIFGDLRDPELDALAADMDAHGQRDPIEVLPNGTVVAGHQRWRAAENLGWTHVDVVVRHDLAKAGEAAAEEYFIKSNFLRRQLSPLGKARCIQRRMEIAEGCSAQKLMWLKRDELKQQIGDQMGLSARSVNRYLSVLATPVEVQHAFDAGLVKLTDAGRVAMLPAGDQAKIAARIQAGESAAAVVGEYLAKGAGQDDVHVAFRRLRSCLQREVDRIDGRVAEVRPAVLQRWSSLLRQGSDLLAKLIARSEAIEEGAD